MDDTFVDEVHVQISAGKGGSGCKSFRREKFVPLGGPNGGDGGSGGSVILTTDTGLNTLLDFQFKKIFEAKNGDPGRANNCSGRAAEDLVLRVPVGTQVYNVKTEELVVDLSEPNTTFVLAKGGRGGKGNTFFKTAINRVPEHFQPGEEGESGEFKFVLKLLADVALVGKPNAGKSTLISRISAARPKIANYPFTTLVPNLGVVRGASNTSFVVADVPGLIEGASDGKGLGTRFLKHIERCRVIAHLLDGEYATDASSLVATYREIRRELELFSEEIAGKPEIIVLSKLDTIEDGEGLLKALSAELKMPVLGISSATGLGIDYLVTTLSRMLAGPVVGK